jgi:hypothetical protein
MSFHTLWAIIHEIALIHMHRDDKQKIKEFYHCLEYVIPCGKCKRHYHNFLRDNPIPDDMTLFDWSVNLHNSVNEKLGKPTMTTDEAFKIWGVNNE